jgi:hypothetical protein
MKLWEGYIARFHITASAPITARDEVHFYWTKEAAEQEHAGGGVHVREVVEPPKEQHIEDAAKVYISPNETQDWNSQINKALLNAFEAGARWAIAKMRGEAE